MYVCVCTGDATLMLPTQTVSEYVLARIEDATKKIVENLEITGPFNIQFIAKESGMYVCMHVCGCMDAIVID